MEEINKVVKKSEEVLMEIRTVFPFTLFRDKIRVDRNQVTVVFKHFISSKEVFPIHIEDIKTVKVQTGPLFAQMLFEIKGFETNPEPVNYLPKQEALEMRRLITGLVNAVKEEVPLEKVNAETAKKMGR